RVDRRHHGGASRAGRAVARGSVPLLDRLMGGGTGALVYLVTTSWRNRLAAFATRLRTPRYAGALVVGALYIYAFLLRPSRGVLGGMLLGRPAEAIVTLLMVLTLMG